MENITHRGTWFLPEDTEKGVVGTLTFNDEDGVNLELDSFFVDPYQGELLRPDIILGDTYDGKQVTLYRCNQYYQGQGSKFSASYILVGHQFTSEEELIFHRSMSSFFNLDQWLGMTGFDNKTGESIYEQIVTYDKPSSVEFTIDNKKCKFDYGLYRQTSRFSVTLSQRADLIIETEKPRPLLKALHDIVHFQNFLTLGIYTATYPSHISLTNNEMEFKLGEHKHRQVIDLYYKPSLLNPVKEEFSFLFCFKDIQDDFPSVIQKWYNLDGLVDDTLYLLFNSFYDTAFNESKFLDMTRAFETFHRRLRNNQERSVVEHEAMISSILQQVSDEKHRAWLSGKLMYSNEPSLRKRLKEIFADIDNKEVKKIIPKKKAFINDVINSRNYHTHYDPKLRKQAKHGAKLFYLSGKLRMILVCAILKEIGIANDHIEVFLRRSYYRLFQFLITKE